MVSRIFGKDHTMSFREKSAWVTLVTVFLSFGVYFSAITIGHVTGRGLPTLMLLIGCVILLTILQIIFMIPAALTTPAAERSAKDEREALILARSNSIGYYVLTTLVLCLAVPASFGHPVADLLNFALLDVVIATLVVSAAQIVMFRRS
jgi:hypothetical protein